MHSVFRRALAGVAVAAVCGGAPVLAAAAQSPPGQAGGRPGQPFGAGGSIVRIGPGGLRSDGATARPSLRGPQSLGDVLFGDRTPSRPLVGPAPGRYAADAGHAFVLDRQSRDIALVRFEDSPEVWALTAAPGPRGDMIFKNDVGEPVLRATRMGGLTLFSPGRPEGEAAAQVSSGAALKVPTSIGPQALIQALAQASARASRAAQHLIAFEAPDVTSSTDWVFADAAWVTSEGFVRAVSRVGGSGRSFMTRVLAVRFVTGPAPDVATQGAVLRITVAPDRGPAGRPSSQRVAAKLAAR